MWFKSQKFGFHEIVCFNFYYLTEKLDKNAKNYHKINTFYFKKRCTLPEACFASSNEYKIYKI